MRYLYLLFCFLLLTTSQAQDAELRSLLDTITLKGFDTLRFRNMSVEKYHELTDYAIGMTGDTTDGNRRVKGEVLLMVLADHIKADIGNGTLNPKKKREKQLLATYKELKHILYQPKVNDFIKLAHYTCEGKFRYIYSRASVTWYFFPAVTVAGIGLLFAMANLFGLIRWKHHKKLNRVVFLSVLLVVLLGFIFKQTCHECVKKDSFYGIPF